MLSLETTFKEKLLDRYRSAPLDAASFHRSYKACAGDCYAVCCSGGSAFYMKEEADTVNKVMQDHRDFFEKNGIPTEHYLDEEWDEEANQMEISTNVRPMDYPPGMLPEHFDKTACVFRRASDGACTLQALGIEQGKPGWWYKPLACWLYPLEIEQSGKPHIHVAHASTDEYTDAEYPGFVGYTPCGKECAGGRPAYEVIAPEIAALSKLLERDLMAEILAYKEHAA